MTSIAMLPHFLLYLVATLAMLAVALLIYTRVTPQDELALIRRGNTAAAVSFGGAVIGFAIVPVAGDPCLGGLLDAVVWGAIGLVVQLGAFLTVTVLLPGWRAALERGEMAGAVLLASASIGVGLLNAACLTP